MTAAERQQLRISILIMLRAQGADAGMATERMLSALRIDSYDLVLPALESELNALADASQVKVHATLAGKRWRITSRGESDLQEAGL